MADVGQRVVMDLRNQLFRHILDQSATFFARRTSGQLLSRLTNDVNQVQNAVSETIADLAQESLALVGYAVLLVTIDWRMTVVVLVRAAARHLSALDVSASACGGRRGAARKSSST